MFPAIHRQWGMCIHTCRERKKATSRKEIASDSSLLTAAYNSFTAACAYSRIIEGMMPGIMEPATAIIRPSATGAVI